MAAVFVALLIIITISGGGVAELESACMALKGGSREVS
jgi:hypothetical protein